MKFNSFLLKSISLIFLVSFFVSCYSQSAHDYRNKLNVISNIEAYSAKVRENPNRQLVDIENIIPGIVLDIHYASKNNFTNEVIYRAPKAFVRKPVADALTKIQLELEAKGLGLKIFDAYRPYAATVKFYEVYPDTNFVAAPWKGSVHNRGCAVDLTIINLSTGKELEMPTPFDDFTKKAAHGYMHLTDEVLANRSLLREIMEKFGFSIYEHEWWHYNFENWESFSLMDISFQNLNQHKK